MSFELLTVRSNLLVMIEKNFCSIIKQSFSYILSIISIKRNLYSREYFNTKVGDRFCRKSEFQKE